MIKKILNGMAWIWLTGVAGLYIYICIIDGVVHTLECTNLDEVGSFITAVASLVLVTNKFVIPDIKKIDVILENMIHKRDLKKEIICK